MEFFAVSLLNGISYGLLLFMLASGLTLIFSMMGVLNFAHASFYMIGAYLAYQISVWFDAVLPGTGYWLALVAAPLAVGALGALVERYGLRRVHRFGHVPELPFTFGLSFIIVELVQLVWGRAALPYRIPAQLDGAWFSLYSIDFPAYRGFMMAVAAFMLLALWVALTRTRAGLIIRAALTHPQMVQALGHDVPRVMMLTFAGGSALAGLAGVIGGNAFVTEPAMAGLIGSIVFVVIVVGGLGSLPGALLASLLLGLLQTFAVGLDWSLAAPLQRLLGWAPAAGTLAAELAALKLSQLAPVLPYLLMVLVLVLRPRGLMGTRES
ncbi:MAG: branched-chain amino acid ABC transporter permease [Burkholderiales bacterium]|nr:branched-chain amino acid ABC transporter permease [Burkholderiales bacterium]